MYNFTKAGLEFRYSHPYFKKNQKNLLQFVVRRQELARMYYKNEEKDNTTNTTERPQSPPSPPPIPQSTLVPKGSRLSLRQAQQQKSSPFWLAPARNLNTCSIHPSTLEDDTNEEAPALVILKMRSDNTKGGHSYNQYKSKAAEEEGEKEENGEESKHAIDDEAKLYSEEEQQCGALNLLAMQSVNKF